MRRAKGAGEGSETDSNPFLLFLNNSKGKVGIANRSGHIQFWRLITLRMETYLIAT